MEEVSLPGHCLVRLLTSQKSALNWLYFVFFCQILFTRLGFFFVNLKTGTKTAAILHGLIPPWLAEILVVLVLVASIVPQQQKPEWRLGVSFEFFWRWMIFSGILSHLFLPQPLLLH